MAWIWSAFISWMPLNGLSATHEGDFIQSASRSVSETAQQPWAYEGPEGPEHWGMLSHAYMACERGSHQSPIDIRMPRHGPGHEAVRFDYSTGPARLMNTGHTIQVTAPPGSVLRLNDREYTLRQFHFHEPSEHHVDGAAYPMELHLVHQDPKGRIAVVAVLMQNGPPHQGVSELWRHVPAKAALAPTEVVVSLANLLPSSTHHFSYAGSLTTPPCSEGVHWLVLKDPIQVSREQVAGYRAMIGDDARPVQPLNSRPVTEY